MYKIIKRFFDLFFAIGLLIVLLPLFLIIIFFQYIYGLTPIIFIQYRSGKNNKNFKINKFKTINNYNQTNKYGMFLRNTGLDELPQLINILKGEMSFIGPRAWITDYTKYFNKRQLKRLEVLPGITGLAQINKCNTVFDKINKDIEYVENISFLLDIKIIIKTILMILLNRKEKISQEAIQLEIKDLKNQK